MPAYSFKERFVPLILDGTKRQTIRQKRKDGRVPKVGDTLYLFFGMRTEYCRKLKEAVCTEVREIIITQSGRIFIDGKRLTWKQKDILAYEDGFRSDLNFKTCAGCFDVMFRWWSQTHDLPFKGDIIYW